MSWGSDDARPQASAASVAASAADLDEIIDSAPTATFLATTEEGILRANHAASALTGLHAEEMLGQRLLHTVVHPDDVPTVTWVGDEVRAGNTAEVRHRLLTASGEVRYIRGTITPIFRDGSLRYGVAQYVDETELVVASREISRQRALLAEFAETVAHDLRSPLAALVGFADILHREEDLSPTVAEIGEMMLESAREASTTVERTLQRALHRKDGGSLTADLPAVLGRIRNLLGPSLAAAGGRIEYVGGVRFLMLEEDGLTEVLLNLCQNSIKYRSADDPHIRIVADAARELLTVEDNGRGIPIVRRTEVFERGAQLETGDDGKGLGLARVRDLIEGFGGSIVAQGNLPAGTSMVMYLPGAFIRGGS